MWPSLRSWHWRAAMLFSIENNLFAAECACLELFSGVWISFDCVTAVVVSFVVDLASGRYGIQKSVCDRLTQNIHKSTHLYKRDSKMTRQRDAAINAERRPLESALPDHHISHIDPAVIQTHTSSTRGSTRRHEAAVVRRRHGAMLRRA